jgi:hypothetical protein
MNPIIIQIFILLLTMLIFNVMCIIGGWLRRIEWKFTKRGLVFLNLLLIAAGLFYIFK